MEMTMAKKNIRTEYEEMTDTDLIKRYQKGEEMAVDVLLTRYKDYIYRLSYRFMHNYEDAMDLMQDVLIRVIRGLKKYEERNYLKGWLYRIISNASINMGKAMAKREIPADKAFEWLRDERESVENELENTFLKEKIYDASLQLKGKQRDVFFLRYYEMLPYDEIGSILKISATSAKSNYFYSLQKMKKHLQEMGVSL